MDQVGETELAEVERRIVARMVEAFEWTLRPGARYDHFATTSLGQRAGPIRPAGHAKQKRADLHIIGLACGLTPTAASRRLARLPVNLPDVSIQNDARRARRPLWGPGGTPASSPWSSTPGRLP